MDNIIEARELQIERKHFYVELRENERVDDFTATIAEVLTNNERAPA
jgi:hypothetical protein